MPIVLKSESLKLLELSGPVQTCNGIALPIKCYGYEIFILIVSDTLKFQNKLGILGYVDRAS
jgi:hypothetical protein